MIRKHTLAYDPDVTEALKALPPLGSTDDSQVDRPAVKLFDMMGNAFWVIWEYDPDDDLGFGYADLVGPEFGELGYIPVSELRSLTPAFRIERDIAVTTLVEGYKSRGLTPPTYLVAV